MVTPPTYVVDPDRDVWVDPFDDATLPNSITIQTENPLDAQEYTFEVTVKYTNSFANCCITEQDT